MENQKQEAAFEMQDLQQTGEESQKFTDSSNIESQTTPRKRDFQKLLKQYFKGFFMFTSTVLTSIIFIASIVSFINFVKGPDEALEVYIHKIIEIGGLSSQDQLLHKSDYEALFHGNPNLQNYSSWEESYGENAPYTQSENYYKDYSYIQESHDLSLYIDVPQWYRYHSHPRSTSTLIDRSVTNKSVTEIYHNYQNGIAAKFYHDLHLQQPVHRIKETTAIYPYSEELVHDGYYEYISFLTQFIMLFTPAINDTYSFSHSERDKLETFISTAISPNDNANGGSSLTVGLEVFNILSLIMRISITLILSVLSVVYLLDTIGFKDLQREDRLTLQIGSLITICLITISPIVTATQINSYDIFKLNDLMQPFSQYMSIGNLEFLKRLQKNCYFEILLGAVWLFTNVLAYIL